MGGEGGTRGPVLGNCLVSKAKLMAFLLTGTTWVTALGWADCLGDGCCPGELWLGEELELQRAGVVCTDSVQHRWRLELAVSVPFAPADLDFGVGVGKAVATLCLLSCSKEQIAKDLLSGEEEEETQSSADDLTPSVTSHEASDLFHNQSGCRCHWPFLHHGCVSHRHTCMA